ncbi:MAG: hypothetical protein FJW20_15010 [Acidimicrobiia bacterium]|nr:hypothetical protein [Acidimicrobiia bacterium]
MRCLLLLLLPLLACAQSTYFPFSIDQDSLQGAPDFSFLNHPLTAADRLFVRDGHFYRIGPDLSPNSADDERVHLFGINFSFGANFPAEADAVRIAQRLRRMGVNLVRLHHLDTSPDRLPENAGSILTTDPYPTMNPVAVARLRRFLSALRQEGIYVNLNLKVGYVFRPSVDRIPNITPFPDQSKPLHMIHPRMIELQTEFTRNTIDALGLAEDAVLAMVEINNESSLLYSWQTSQLDRHLVSDYHDEFHRQWNAFLRARYDTTLALAEAWRGGEEDGVNLLGPEWRVENQSGEPATLERAELDGHTTLTVRHSASTRPIILKQVGFSVTEGRQYLAEFELRADLPAGVEQTVYWDVKQDVNPWQTIMGRNVAISRDWRKFTIPLTAGFSMNGIGRFGLSIERVTAPVHLRNARLLLVGRRGLAAGESLEDGNVSLPRETEASIDARANDYLLFLADRDRFYLNEMLHAVREAAHPLVPVAGTQMNYGGLLNMDSHDDLQYQDAHFYVDHYNFPNLAWDNRDWRIRDGSNLGAGSTPFLNMAASRQAGRPYTVSEFNQNWPNTHAAELNPTLSAFARFQDWDSIMHFAYAHNRSWDLGGPQGFDMNGDWTKFPAFGQSAWLFRSGAIEAGSNPVDIPLTLDHRLRSGREKRNGNIPAFLTSAFGYDPYTAFVHPVRLVKDAEGALPENARSHLPPYLADNGQFTFDRNNRRFLLHAPAAAGAYGFLGAGAVTTGALDVQLAPGTRGFAAVTLTPLDGLPIAESRRMLLSNPGAAFGSQPGADPPRPQQLVRYQGQADWFTAEPDQSNKPSGQRGFSLRPTWMERVELFLTLRTSASSLTVYTLDGAGNRTGVLTDPHLIRVEGGFRIHLQADGQQLTPWFEIAAE